MCTNSSATSSIKRRLMRHDEDRLALIANSSQHRRHIASGMHIDVGERLIQQHQLGIVQHGARQRQPLPHALRILADAARRVPDRVRPSAWRCGRSRRREFHKARRSSAGSPCRSVRRRAAARVPCSRRGARPRERASHPSIVKLPWLGSISPATTRSRVLLPAPLSPTMT